LSIRRRKFLELGAAATAAAAFGGCAPPPFEARTPPRPDDGGPRMLDGKIEHFIVLMMENRSYDQMLGSLRGPEYDSAPENVWLSYADKHDEERFARVGFGAPPDSFSPDPGHNFQAIEQQIYGSGLENVANMRGFARRFAADHDDISDQQIAEYLTLYGDGRLPILQGLAKEYGVCSHWFCSLPSSTSPNRLFTHAGTSAGVTRKGAYFSRVAGKLIFDKLEADKSRSFRVYFHDMPHLWLTGDAWMKMFGSHFSFMHGFERDVRADQLASYTFIEPQHVLPPWSSQHPSGGVSHGEELIARVYNTLVSNPKVFQKSLLLIVYDEHGGFYDHVIPPGHPGWQAQCPGVEHKVVAPDRARGVGIGRENGYDFTTLGPRVPAVVVSPWIERGSVFGWKSRDPRRRATFDHTSILATVGKMSGVWLNSERARAATSLDITLNRQSPRRDYPTWLDYHSRHYREVKPSTYTDHPSELAGVGQELYDHWSAEHGDAPPSVMLEHVRKTISEA
jgi:phospholipase C